MHRVRVGTRGSALARAQTRWVIEQLSRARPDASFEEVIITTSGDRGRVDAWPGAFTRELEEALLAGKIDIAVHSLKDLPTEQPPGLVIGAIPPRGDPRDALISREGHTLATLPEGARIGTTSERRAVQLLAFRPDLTILGIRGNVDTRLRKLSQGDCEAIVLASAGLHRLGRAQEITEVLPLEIMLPAPGQGALAVEVRADDKPILDLVSALDHLPTRKAVQAEREFLRVLGGGCRIPVGAYATVEEDGISLSGMVGTRAGRILRGSVRAASPEEAAWLLREQLSAESPEIFTEAVLQRDGRG
ncbi:MAG: hydroxymethylbilane synthase [Armatimonadota bacterium]|nr:hydroxymethylbilane synthase [Armatimonadota bacterium]